MTRTWVIRDTSGEPVAIFTYDGSLSDPANALRREATNEYTNEQYLFISEEITVLTDMDELRAFAKEHMAKLGEAYYDSHYQSAAQLAGESTL